MSENEKIVVSLSTPEWSLSLIITALSIWVSTQWLDWRVFLVSLGAFLASGALIIWIVATRPEIFARTILGFILARIGKGDSSHRSFEFSIFRELFLLSVNPGFLSGSIVGFFAVRSWDNIWLGVLPSGIVVLLAFMISAFFLRATTKAPSNHGWTAIGMLIVAFAFGAIAISIPYALAGTIAAWQVHTFPNRIAGSFLVLFALGLVCEVSSSTKHLRNG